MTCHHRRAALFSQHQVLETLAFVAVTFNLQAGRPDHGHFQRRAVPQRLGNLVQTCLCSRCQHCAARRKTHHAEFVPAATKGTGQQTERRGDGFDNQIDDHLENNGPQPELRVINRATDWQIDVDDTVAICQQRHCQFHWQTVGRALHLFTKRELVEDEVVAGRERAVWQHDVGHVHAELAALDAVACVFHAVGRQRWQLQVAHLALDVQRQRFGQWVEFAQNFQRCRALRTPAQFQIGELWRTLHGYR